MFPRVLTRLVVLLIVLCTSGCSTLGYVLRQGRGQLHLLQTRRQVADVLADPTTPPLVRQRLRLVMAARDFGIRELGLRGGADFTRYVATEGPVAYNLTAALRTRLRTLTWTFPLIGTVPYLGYFSRQEAEAAVARLQQQGYDTYLRPVAAYSALGYLISPIYASMIDDPDALGAPRAVETILHEMAHSTAYLHSSSELNESFATVVGIQGAARFYRERGQGSASAEVLRDAQEGEQRAAAFSAWLQPALQRLRAFYDDAQRRGLSEAEIRKERGAIFQELSASYRRAFPAGPRYRRLAEGPINNAVMLAFGVYHRSGDFQQLLLDSAGGDLRAYINLYRRAARRSDGPAWLQGIADAFRGHTRVQPGLFQGK